MKILVNLLFLLQIFLPRPSQAEGESKFQKSLLAAANAAIDLEWQIYRPNAASLARHLALDLSAFDDYLPPVECFKTEAVDPLATMQVEILSQRLMAKAGHTGTSVTSAEGLDILAVQLQNQAAQINDLAKAEGCFDNPKNPGPGRPAGETGEWLAKDFPQNLSTESLLENKAFLVFRASKFLYELLESAQSCLPKEQRVREITALRNDHGAVGQFFKQWFRKFFYEENLRAHPWLIVACEQAIERNIEFHVKKAEQLKRELDLSLDSYLVRQQTLRPPPNQAVGPREQAGIEMLDVRIREAEVNYEIRKRECRSAELRYRNDWQALQIAKLPFQHSHYSVLYFLIRFSIFS